MSEYDPLKSDAYAKHLSDVNQTNSVFASENIYNQKGALLVQSGAKLESRVTEKLLQHRLMKPLQDSVRVENSFDGNKLYEYITQWLQDHKDLTDIHEANQLDRPLKAMCNRYARHRNLQQMITVLAKQMPKVFEKGCFCAWLGIGIAQQQQLSPTEAEAAFIAALCHDIGLLHIPPEIVNKTGQYEPAEWRTMQGHTVIGQVLTKSIPNLDKSVPRAILEHHEACDGTGYPVGKSEEKLHPIGQIVALCDTLFPLRFGDNSTQGSLKSLKPFMKINQSVHMYQNYTALASVINKAQLPPMRRKSDEEMPAYCQSIIFKYDLLSAWGYLIHQIMAKLPDNTAEKQRSCAQKIYLHIIYIVKASGLFNLGIKRWVEHVINHPASDVYAEIEDIGLMYEEVLWHMRKLFRQLSLINDEAKHLGNTCMQDNMAFMAELNNHSIPDPIKTADDFELEKAI